MAKKLSYIEMRNLFDTTIDNYIFNVLVKVGHGWNKNEFLECYKQEILAEMDEETYDIAIQAHTTIQ